MSAAATLLLASASPRRTELLARWNLPHLVRPSDFDEVIDDGVAAGPLAENLAQSKMRDVRSSLDANELSHSWVLAADTLVSCRGRHLGKPGTPERAREMLAGISGQEVVVTTGVSIGAPGGEWLGFEQSVVLMRDFDAEEIDLYVAGGEPLDKAGAFAVQGEGGRLIAKLDGSRTNVIGLPRRLVLALLKQSGFPTS